ncbi:WD40 repeat domain-containing serine/threonine protein kinase [Nocardia crassostreae]|uniref:WD40 repeat domain-containing serine/threonine protein kinase n=1 Tax=Nocardia crassostreae TaxID=53428 RepID=UPI000AAD4FD0|nr:serine/threonine-protein kinase [Nocardia crassostreae]
MAVEPGTIFAGYLIRRRIGAGGMGAVYLAGHPRLPMDIALKILDPDLGRDSDARARFHREAEIAARLRHPNIVQVYDRGSEGEHLWIAMDYIDGPDAGQLLRTGPLDPHATVDLIAQAARALDYAHRNGVLHRDIKPANLLVASNGEPRNHLYLTDFGIARSLDDTATLTTSIRATLAYAPPELLAGEPLDQRADVYSLGGTLYHLLTGALPYPRNNLAAVMHAHLQEPPPRPSALRPYLPTALDEVIAIALAKDRTLRFPTCTALADAARSVLRPPPPVDEIRGSPHPLTPPPSSITPPPGYVAAPPTEITPPPGYSAAPPTRITPPPIHLTEPPPRSVFTRRRLLTGAGVAAPVVAAAVGIPLLVRASRDDPPDTRYGVSGDALLSDGATKLRSVAFHPGGSIIATGSMDGSVQLWDSFTRATVGAPLTGHSGTVASVAFDSEGATLVSAGADAALRVWNTRTRKQIGLTLTSHTASLTAAAFVPGRSVVATAGSDTTVLLWDTGTGGRIGEPITGNRAGITALAVSPDGATLATASRDGATRLWNIQSGKQIGTIGDSSAAVYTVAFDRTGSLLAVGGSENATQMFRTDTRTPDGDPYLGKWSVSCVAFSPTDDIFAAVDDLGSLQLWSHRTRTRLGDPMKGHDSAITSICFSPDGATLASVAADTSLCLWNIRHRLQ